MSIEWIIYLGSVSNSFIIISWISLIISLITTIAITNTYDPGEVETIDWIMKFVKRAIPISCMGIIFLPSETTINKILVAHYVKQNEFDKLPKKLIDVVEKYLEGEK